MEATTILTRGGAEHGKLGTALAGG
jgi:hypothetical protein